MTEKQKCKTCPTGQTARAASAEELYEHCPNGQWAWLTACGNSYQQQREQIFIWTCCYDSEGNLI